MKKIIAYLNTEDWLLFIQVLPEDYQWHDSIFRLNKIETQSHTIVAQ